jgi:transcriptional regulator with XRE-family HTH domain
MINNIDIGSELRQIIEQKGIKIVWLAKQVGCDDSNLNKWLQKRHIHPELLLKISIALNINLFDQYNQEYLKSINLNDE